MCMVQVLAIFVYDVAYDIVYDIVCQMYDIVYKFTISYTISYKMYDIVCFWTDVVYDMPFLVAIIRYRTYISYASSLLYDIVRPHRKKHTM